MNPRSRTPLLIGIVVAVVAVLAVVAVVVTRGGDDDDGGDVVVAPPVVGQDFAGNEVTFTPGADGPMMVVFLAHWCPHCNAEIPVLQEWQASGAIPEGLEVIGVSTAARDDAPNYPPGEWLEAMGWEWPAIDDDGTLAETYDIEGFPAIYFIDADGSITGTTTGERTIEELQPLADEAVA